MMENDEVFIETVVDNSKCIDCGLCAKRSPQLNVTLKMDAKVIEVYAIKILKSKRQVLQEEYFLYYLIMFLLKM